MTALNVEKLLDAIDSLNEKIEESIEKLIAFCNNRNEEIRYRALESLQCIKTTGVESTVYKSLDDQDELVKTTSIEIIGYWKEKKAEDKIFVFLKDNSSLVKSAAAISLGQIGSKKYGSEIVEMLKTADSIDKVGLCYYLCRIGKYEYFPQFLNGLSNELYRIRCSTANLLVDLVDENNIDFAINHLNLIYNIEETEAVKSSIKNALRDLTEHKKGMVDVR